MASLPPPGLPSSDAEDPWDWSVDQVAKTLCDPASPWLSAIDPLSRPDPIALDKALRKEGVSGPILLTQIDHANLREDLGIRALGPRGTIVLWIRHLRNQSRRYSDHILEDAANTPLPSIGMGSSGWPDSRASTPFYQTPLYRPNRAVSVLPTVFHSPTRSTEHVHPTTSGLLPVSAERNDRGTQPDRVSITNLLEGPKLITSRLQLPELQDTTDKSEEHGTIKSLLSKSGADGSGLDGHLNIGALVVADENEPVSDPPLYARQGETYITDSSGRKRRKLVLGPAFQPLAGALVTLTSSRAPAVERPHMMGVDDNLLAEDVPSPDTIRESDDADLTEASRRPVSLNPPTSYMVDEPLPPSFAEQTDAIPSKATEHDDVLVLDKRGRRRLKPTLISKVPGQVAVQFPGEPSSPVSVDTAEESLPIPATETKNVHAFAHAQADPRGPRKLSQVYMGPTSFPVDNIFYGSTHIRKQLAVDTREHIDLQHDSYPDYDGDNFMFDSTGYFGTGRRLYVHSRLKHFLGQCERKEFIREDQHVIRIAPYPADVINRKGQILSVTKFMESPHGTIVTREKRYDGMHLDNDLAFEGLEKYKYLDGGDVVLPVYGDSGSEYDYDSDFFKEMENDGKKKKANQLGRPRGEPLPTEEILAAIEDATKAIISEWESKRLTKFRRKSWKIWRQARRDRNKRTRILSLMSKIEGLDNRLTKMKAQMLAELWYKVKHVKRQCKSMEPTLFDREAYKWEVSILESTTMPDKPPASEKKYKAYEELHDQEASTQDDATSTSESNSEPSDDDMNDFIDDEAVAGQTEDSGLATADNNEPTTPNDVEDDSHNDNTALFSARVKLRHPSFPFDAKQVDTSLDQSPREVEPGLNFGQDEDDDVGSLPTVKEEGISKGSDGLRAERIMLLSARKAKPFKSDSNVVDLTLSDPIAPSTPIKAKVSSRLSTSPVNLSEDDPFRRVRSAKATFKDPFKVQPSGVIDLESDSISSDLDEIQSIHGPEKLPAFDDVQGIIELGSETWTERRDRMRLLIWRIEKTPAPSRRNAFLRMDAATTEANERAIQAGLKAMLRSAQKLRGEDTEQSDAIMMLAAWYICWTVCVVAKGADGVNKKHVQTTIDDVDGFAHFWNFLKDCRKHYKDVFPKTAASIGLSPKTVTPSKRKLESDIDSPDNAPANDYTTPHKNRKKLVKASQEALDLQKNARQRVRDKEAQQVKLKARLKRMGLNEDDCTQKVINVGNSDDGDLIFLHPDIGSRIKAHQLDGVRFMWREIVTNDEKPEGCLLAQTMGLGKTMQVISLLVTIAEAVHSSNENISKQIPERLRDCRTLILCPVTLVDNWVEEFLLWQPQPKATNFGEIRAVLSSMQFRDRLYEIREWRKHGGILLLGYTTFRNLLANKANKDSGRYLSEADFEELEETLLEWPSIVVADEAHTIKNESSTFYKAVSRFKTRSRIALTGSPLSNNLEEYYTIIDWVAHGFLGDRVEFRAHYVEPIKEGSFQESSKEEVKKSRQMLHVLNSRLEPKMHRADMSTIRSQLKGKTEFVVIMPLTPVQKTAYEDYVNSIHPTSVESQDNEPGTATLWAWIAILRLLVNHPKCFLDRLTARQTEKVSQTAKTVKPNQQKLTSKKNENVTIDDSDDIDREADLLLEAPVAQLGISPNFVSRQVALFREIGEPLNSVGLAYKMQILIYLLDCFKECCDKALVFSHSLPTLDYVETLLRSSNRSYVRLDGKTRMSNRQQLTKDFNKKDTDICLTSTRAGGTGLNLYGANRVIILDEHYNPSWEQQAVGRSYRIGQQKHVYVYRLTVGGTFEVVIQNQALFKQQLASRVVDKKNPKRHALRSKGEYMRPPAHVEQEDLTEFMGKDPVGLDRILADPDKVSCIRAIKLSETLEQEDSFELTAEERVDAERIRQNEQLRLGDPAGYRAMMADRQAALLKGVNTAMGRTVYPFNQAMPNSAPASFLTQQLPTYPSNSLESHPQPQSLSADLSGSFLSQGPPGFGPPVGQHMMNPVLASNTRIRASTASLSPEKEVPFTAAAAIQDVQSDQEQSISNASGLVQDRTASLIRSVPIAHFDNTASQKRHQRAGHAATQQVATTDTDPGKSSPSQRAPSTGYDSVTTSSISTSRIASRYEQLRNSVNAIQLQKTARANVKSLKTVGRQGDPPKDKTGLSDGDTSMQNQSRDIVLEDKNRVSVNATPTSTGSKHMGIDVSTEQALAAEKASLNDSNPRVKSLSQQVIDTVPTAKGEGEELRGEDKPQEIAVSAPANNGRQPVTGSEIARCVPESGISVLDLTRLFCKRVKTEEQKARFLHLVLFYCNVDAETKRLVLKKPKSSSTMTV